MEREDWNRKHGEAGLLFGAEPNRFLVAEVADAAAGPRARPRLRLGAERRLARAAGLGGDGVDFADVALEQARGLAAERGVEVEWLDADLRDWEPPVAAFDLVVVLYLQLPAEELGADPRGAAAAAVAPGGTLLVVGHHSDNLEHGSGGPKDPRVLFTPEDVAGSLDGLEIEKAEAVLRPVEGERDAIDVLVRARRP